MEKPLDTEATMISYLLEVGWQLYVTDVPGQPPKLVKRVRIGSTTEMRTCDVSVGTVIELQTFGKLKERRQFRVGNVRTYVYVLREIPK